MNIFQRAQQGLNLTPAQRAFLKLVEGLVIAAIVTSIPIIGSAVATHLKEGSVDWGSIALFSLGTFSTVFAAAVVKYCKAHGDSPLAQLVGGVAQNVEDRLSAQFGLNETVIEAEIGGDTPQTAPTPTPTDAPVDAPVA